MCRWLGYLGSPIEPRELLYDPERSLIEQSRTHAPGMPVPNGDGFGLGWYGRRAEPALFHSDQPAWGDRNLRTLSSEITTPLLLAHVRAATGTPVQETNCHPFGSGRWMFVHNGYVADHARLRRDLVLAVRPDLFSSIEGSTDSEVLFHLAITFGLFEEPIAALERMAGFVESVAAAAGVPDPLQMTLGLTDGERLYAVRYASGPEVNACTSAPTSRRCGSSTRPRSGSRTSHRRPGWSCPSHSWRCPGSGTRYRPARRWSWRRGASSSCRSGPAGPAEPAPHSLSNPRSASRRRRSRRISGTGRSASTSSSRPRSR